ncbi:zinc metalloprotease [Pedobacter metabolipauper]|uniref:Dual-action HEIGH metallo-peptidase n=1 Tax=Pedobacter metabolipauper TaxID=425513 RepID=A0A4R6SR38_9SPHI|nr:M57 family metalloprotease [Pedobacter metabolipauper]TDQ07450.1 dual-action HEIGH metallo-peptidase [Pedobacter metabolipauper]
MKTQTTLNRFTIRLALAAVLLTSVISSCKKTDEPTAEASHKQAIDAATLSKIETLGYSTKEIKDLGAYYLVENDILLSKETLAKSKGIEKLMGLDQGISQAQTPYLISGSYQNVTISIDQSIWGNSTWYSAVVQAVVIWNSTANSNIKLNLFIKDYDPSLLADIEIRGDNGAFDIYTAAGALPPTYDGKPGNLILVNTDFRDPNTNYFIDNSQTTWNMIHEIGHTLGLRHTNWDEMDEGYAAQIPNTPNTDAYSVMNGGTAISSYSSSYPALPSVYDAAAITTLYPINTSSTVVPMISGPSTFSGERTFHMSYKSLEAGLSYHWEVTGISGTTYYYGYTGSENIFELSLSPGSYQIKCSVYGGKYSTTGIATKNVTVN